MFLNFIIPILRVNISVNNGELFFFKNKFNSSISSSSITSISFSASCEKVKNDTINMKRKINLNIFDIK